MKYLFYLLLILPGIASYGQTDAHVGPSGKVYDSVDKMPVASDSCSEYIMRTLRYPDDAREDGIDGRVIIKFTVNEDGSISDCLVESGIGGGCDEEALRVVKGMPRFKPGMLNGTPVKVYFRQPISFKLEGGRPRRKNKKK